MSEYKLRVVLEIDDVYKGVKCNIYYIKYFKIYVTVILSNKYLKLRKMYHILF